MSKYVKSATVPEEKVEQPNKKSKKKTSKKNKEKQS